MVKKPTYEELELRVNELEIETEKRKQAEEALRESEEKYRLIFDSSDEGIIIIQDSNAVFLNRRILDMRGISSGEMTRFATEPFLNFIHTDDRELVATRYIRRLKGEEVPSVYSARLIKEEGGHLWVDLSPTVISWEGRPATLVFLTDITNRKRAEKENAEMGAKLQRSQKMESMGLLASGVAHDLNNVLSGIVSYPELILMDLPEDSKLRKPIETIQDTGHRAAAIVQDLLTVARGVATAKEPITLNELVSNYLQSPEFEKLEHFHPAVICKSDLDSGLFNVSGSPVHIGKVVMNLVSNAAEAIEGGGNVVISTMNRYVDMPLKGYDKVNIGEYAVLSVSDDGPGISSVDLDRIFEPFYTKKVMGKSGTGLGLAVVWNVMQDHKGYIDVKTYENGTTFELYFPITRDEVLDKYLSVPIEEYKGTGETILVVDDAENQRDISCKILETFGYKAEAVSSGEEAVEYLKKSAVDLVLLDMIMDPGINGRETYERIVKVHPGQKAVIVSGFAETDEVKEAQKLGAGKYVKKPFTLEKIGLAVKEELEK